MTDFESDLAHKIDTKTKPLGALGRIETIAAKVARLQKRLDPEMTRCRLVIFAADHGIADEGVSAFPAEVTRQMVLNFASGGAAANVFARAGGLDLSVVNAGVRGGPFDLDGVVEAALGDGTGSFLTGPAMTHEQVDTALQKGRAMGAEGDAQACAFGEMGIGNTSAAAVLAHRLSGAALDDLIGRGTGLDDEGLLRKAEILRRSNARVGEIGSIPEILAEFGGFEIVMMAGAMIGAAEAGRVVLVDGYIASVAAMIAAGLAPATRDAMIFATLSAEPGHRLILDAMAAEPLLELDLRLGEGTGAALAWPLVRAAVAMLNEMASFEEAGVSDRA